jgi:hypothetical protein
MKTLSESHAVALVIRLNWLVGVVCDSSSTYRSRSAHHGKLLQHSEMS